jgi:hypothetical protein
MAQAVAQARSREEHPHALSGAVEALDKDPLNPIRWFLLGGGTLQHPIGLGQGCGTSFLGVASIPDHTTTDDRGKGHFRCQTTAVFFISQDVRGQGQATLGQYRHHTVVAQGAPQTIESHRRDRIEDCTERHTQASMRRQEGVASALRAHLARAQDEVGEDRAYRFARGALDPPDGETTQPETDRMGVACETPASTTGRFGGELKAQREQKGKDTLDTRLAIGKQTQVGAFVLKINGDGAILPYLFACVSHVSPWCKALVTQETPWE